MMAVVLWVCVRDASYHRDQIPAKNSPPWQGVTETGLACACGGWRVKLPDHIGWTRKWRMDRKWNQASDEHLPLVGSICERFHSFSEHCLHLQSV